MVLYNPARKKIKILYFKILKYMCILEHTYILKYICTFTNRQNEPFLLLTCISNRDLSGLFSSAVADPLVFFYHLKWKVFYNFPQLNVPGFFLLFETSITGFIPKC